MNVYMYQSDLLCEKCGEDIRGDTPKPEGYEEGDESSYDSDDYPKGPYDNGGGEADTPQHCSNCGIFLKNPLTEEGYEYVKEEIEYAIRFGSDWDALREWFDYYGFCITCNEIKE